MNIDQGPMDAPAGAPVPPDPDSCAGIVELITDYLEGALDAGIRARFDAHLAGCDGCDRYLEQMRATIAAAGRIDVDRIAPAVLDRLVAAYRSALAT